ncbi:MAG: 50S ribosomal protein L10 [Candidatus Levybacteria bacterium]|nr:50S ribosomal protein L10 [Candidatus Levybacteria bacterium]
MNDKKVAIVAQLSQKASKAKAVVFTNYQGMTHPQLEQLKKALKNTQAEMVVAKNTLLKIALGQNQNLEGPTGTIFAYEDVVNPLKELAKTIKTLKLPLIKFGIIEGRVLAEADIVRLSTLPSREVLLAQFVGGIKAPLYGLHRALNWNIQKFVMTLQVIKDKKEGGD